MTSTDTACSPPSQPSIIRQNKPLKIAYLMSRFPKISETFILYEILQHERNGIAVEVFALRRERQPVMHPEAEKLLPRVHFLPVISGAVIKANLQVFLNQPATYLRTLAEVLIGNLGSLNRFAGALGYFPVSVRFAKMMQQQKVSHLHAHFCNHPAVVALIIHRLTGIPYSFTAHGSDLHKDKRMLDRKVEAAAFAVTVSDFNKSEMIKKCGESLGEKIHIIRCGIDPEVFAPRAEEPPDSPFRIVCVGSFEEVKGHKYLVKACKLLEQRGIDFVCDLVGEGPVRPAVEQQIAAAGLQDRVIVHGSLPRLEVARLYQRAHVKALASVPTADGKREGVPVVIMEAMASGLPVVSSQLSGIPELVQHERTGILLPPRGVEGIADAFERLYRDRELRHRMGKAGRERVLREFNLIKSTERLGQLIAEVALGSGNNGRNS